MRKSFILILLTALLMTPLASTARDFKVTFANDNVEKVIAILEQATGYDFVGRKEVVSAAKSNVNGTYTASSIDDLLNDIVRARLGLDYEIVDNTVILRTPTPDSGELRLVKGNVTDESGEPLPGAIIAISGTDYGTTTDVDGNFSLKIPVSRKCLEVSYVGMRTKNVDIKDYKTPLSVELTPAVEMMSEVVVTGYQEIKKEKMTGSVATISADKLENRYTPNLLDNLEGRVAGLSTYGGKPVIRGTGTLHAGTNPLLVVDGLPIEGSINDINPYDIESINILKDAAAAAIYGARASNGIIVITTKDAKKKGKIDIDFSANFTWHEKKNVDYHDNYYMTPEEQVMVESEYYDYYFNSGEKNNPMGEFEKRLSDGKKISPLQYAYYQNAAGAISKDELEAIKTQLSRNNFAKQLADNMLHRQFVQQYNLSLRSVSDISRNNVVVNYKHDNVGKFNHKDEWLNVSYKGAFEIAKWLTATIGINGIYSNTREYGGGYETAIYSPFSYEAYQPYMNADGTVMKRYYGNYGNDYTEWWSNLPGITDMIVDPRQEALDNTTTTRRQEMRYHADLLFKIIPGLTANTQFIYEVTSNEMKNHANENSWSARELRNVFTVLRNGKVTHLTPENGGYLRTQDSHGNYWTLRGQLNFNRSFGKHDIAAIAGTEFRQTKIWGEKHYILGYDDQLQSTATHTVDFDALTKLGYQAPYWRIGTDRATIDTDQFQEYNGLIPNTTHRYASAYFNATYTYDERFNIFGSFRKDYADVYGLNAKFRGKPLWSVGAGWNIHNEDFVHDLTWINFLKLRYSYGVTGNIYQGATSYMTATTGQTNSDTNQPYGEISSPANPNLRWEKNTTHNAGIDFSFMNYRLRGSLDYYHRKGEDIFGNKLLDGTTGFTSMNANVASIVNKGLEITLGYDWFRENFKNDFSWSTNITFTYNKNEVIYVENPQTTAWGLIRSPYKTGYHVNALWMFKFAKIDDTPGREGQQLYYTADGGTDYNMTFGSADNLHYAGQSDPKVIVGLDNQMRWKNFSLGFLLSYYGGHKMFCLPYNNVTEGYFYGPINTYYLNAWTPDNPTDIPAIGQWAHSQNNDAGLENHSSRALHDADFIKLRNIVIGYDLPSTLLRHSGINHCSLRFQINNPKALWTKDHADFDPETGGIRIPSSYVVGLNINL
ncbi:MAG: SusC/RagA family TonB-linked outer membrane protein [Duncaniella sp.]|nr:SusC/RagA family TonB-linked outer membrane protein [Duncaniella sp.]